MASTVLPNGIIVPEKFSRDWYADLYHNWQELDNLLAGGGGANDGTLTIQKNGNTVGTFSANQATDETINISVPDVNNGTLTIQQNGADIGTFSANQETNETINIVVPNALPTGSYIQFAGSQAPDGFLVCNGGEISRTTYSALFAVIGTTYGSGDGSTTFNLPNLTDRFLQGSTTSGTVKNAGLPNIKGDVVWNAHTGNSLFTLYLNPAPAAGANAFTSGYSTAEQSSGLAQGQIFGKVRPHTVFDASNCNDIYGNSTTVQPPALTCLICIKY
jgi:hypothetical protein